MGTAAIYLRSNHHDDDAIDHQRQACLAWAAERGVTVTAQFVDNGHASVQPGALSGLIQVLDQGAGYDLVLAYSLDRFGRRSETLEVLRAAVVRTGADLATVKDGRATPSEGVDLSAALTPESAQGAPTSSPPGLEQLIDPTAELDAVVTELAVATLACAAPDDAVSEALDLLWELIAELQDWAANSGDPAVAAIACGRAAAQIHQALHELPEDVDVLLKLVLRSAARRLSTV